MKALEKAAIERAAIVDEYGELKRQIAEQKPVVDRAKLLENTIQSWFADAPADQTFIVSGARYEAQVGMRSKKRRIFDTLKLFAILGKAKFFEWCTVPLEVIDRIVPEGLHSSFLTEERTGSRSVKPVAKAVVMPSRKGAKAA